MNKTYLTLSSILVLLMPLILISGCKTDYSKRDYLIKVLNNLDKIKSAEYNSIATSGPSGDTIGFGFIHMHTVEYFNPADTLIGSSFVETQLMGNTNLEIFYDGRARTYLDWMNKTITIDSIKANTSYRPVAPFFNFTKSILRYTMDTKDSIVTDLKDYGDSIKFSLFIPNKIIEFYGKPVDKDDSHTSLSNEEKFSRYEIWINKSDDLPFRYRRDMPYNTSSRRCDNVQLNQKNIEDFVPSRDFPPDFIIKKSGDTQTTRNDLTGRKAPEWTLIDSENNSVALNDFKSKVLMIEFTGIGCAPCHSAIPFLTQLVIEYNIKDFELVSIETWSQNMNALKRYRDNNKLNYKTLVSTDDVEKIYNVDAVPVFFILDKERVIRKTIKGYGKETTDKEIRDAIKELM
jgi:thiol-disulfide isomerase/thioredoxin